MAEGLQARDWANPHPDYDGETVDGLGAATFGDIRAALAASAGWRPIESAPRDGTRVMTWRPFGPCYSEMIQRWQDCDDDGRPALNRDGACDGNWADDEGMWCAHPPTRWMPLPSPPSEAASPLGGPTGVWRNNEEGVGDLTTPYKPVAIHFEEADTLDFVERDVPTVSQSVYAGLDVLLTVDTREPIGWRIYGWSRISPPPIGGDGEGSSCAMSGGTASPKSESPSATEIARVLGAPGQTFMGSAKP